MPHLPIEAVGMADGSSTELSRLGRVIASELVKRINVPVNSSTTPDQIAQMAMDPWKSSGKYALGWAYFGVILVVCTTFYRMFNYWGDKIRTALFKEEVINSAIEVTSAVEAPPYYDQYELSNSKSDDLTRHLFSSDALPTSRTFASTRHFFPAEGPLIAEKFKQQATVSSINPINNTVAFLRFVFYRPIPTLTIWKWSLSFPSMGVLALITAGLLFSVLYCFLPRPLFFSTLEYGSPPVAIRAGMLSVALLPWIVALAAKVNFISFLTGIPAERLIVLHRWAAYLCILLAIIHAVPYWWQSKHDPVGFAYFKQYFNQQYYIFTTGIAALAPLLFLFFHSLPILRYKAYELFVFFHVPVSWAFVAMMFWHCHNYLTSWAYLYATVVLMAVSLIGRIFHLNWSNPLRPSFLIGEESLVTILPENALKITIPTQKRWRPGQYAYIRMPGIAALDNHPFTIASLCSEDFPSAYGDEYRDMTLVFRPFGGFTRKVLDTATRKGPYKTYRAFVEGPYGGMQRQMSSFDQVIFFAGGSGITAIASQLLDLIKRMRDGKATTTTVHVIWAMKRPEIMHWFKEELRICRECAPPGSMHCNFYITSARRYQTFPAGNTDTQINRLSGRFGEKMNEAMQGIASKRNSKVMEEMHPRRAVDDEITALPQMHLAPPRFTPDPTPYFPPPPAARDVRPNPKNVTVDKQESTLSAVYAEAGVPRASSPYGHIQPPQLVDLRSRRAIGRGETNQTFDFGFGFPSEPTPVKKSLMRPAFLPTTTVQPDMPHIPLTPERTPKIKVDTVDGLYTHGMPAYSSPSFPPQANPYRPRDGWRTEYGRPDIPFALRSLSTDFGRRTCVFVCGPPQMREDVARTVAELQKTVWQHPDRDELFLHTENYSI